MLYKSGMIKAVLIILSFSLLIIAGSIGYYFVLYLPQKDQALMSQNEANKKSQMYLQSICIDDAQNNYKATWADDCKVNAERVKNGYNNCISEGLGNSFCLTTWATPDATPSCSLPSSTAESLNKQLQQEKDNCFKQFPL